MQLRLYGSLTSPYVRRIRIYLHERSLAYDWVDATTDDGQAQLRALTPLWKIPALELDGTPVWDSGVILQTLEDALGPGPLGKLPTAPSERNLLTAIDGATDALINTMYLERDGVSSTDIPYLMKQKARAKAALEWLSAGLATRSNAAFGWPELHACTALEWMLFRGAFPVENHVDLLRCVQRHAARASLIDTRPPGLELQSLGLTAVDS